MNKYLAIIPARGGSKGIPKKNIRVLVGKPLIAYTIEAAKRSKNKKRFDLICSTDDPQIARISEKYGCSVPFLRPKKYATDSAKSIDVVLHALKFMEDQNGMTYDAVILLQPTSPLRKAKHIDEAIKLFESQKCDSLVSVVEPNFLPLKMMKMNQTGFLSELIKTSDKNMRRQDMPPIYALNGAIYITRRELLIKQRKFYGKQMIPYIMDERSSVDIDKPEDIKKVKELIG